MADELFSKRLPITVKCSDREDRKVNIQVTVEMHTTATPVHRKELVIRLTDESDLFFLYTLQLTDEDFQSLKIQQGLLVDFGSFPQKFVDLLQLVLQEEHKEVPKFILDFVCSGGNLGASTGVLNVIETNPFKHLVHLALKFIPGTDTDIKKYLAGCLKSLKDQNKTLLAKFEHVEGDLSRQLSQTKESLTTRTQELDNLKAEWAAKLTELSAKHTHELAQTKDQTFQTQTSVQQRYDREKREMEQSHMHVVNQLNARLREFEVSNKDLTDRKYKSESSIRELRSKLTLLEEEHLRTKQELQSLRKNNAGLDADYHEQDKVINQLKTRLAVMEQEIKDKEELVKKTSDLYKTEQDQKKMIDESLDSKQRKIGKLEMTIKTMSDEITKGNEIIRKLQGEIKSYHTKLKLRTQVTTEQEKLLGEKGKELEEIRKDLSETKSGLSHKEDEVKKLNESLETTMQKLEESRQLLKTNENVINWLNKQVTEAQLGGQRMPTGAFEMNSTGSTLSGVHRPAPHSYNPGIGAPPGRLSTSSHHATPPGVAVPPIRDHYQPRSAAGPQVQYNPHSRKSPVTVSVGMPLAKSSPLGVATIPEETHVSLASPAHLSHAKTASQGPHGDGFLDSKYLQKTGESVSQPQLGGRRSTSPIPIHFGSGQLGGGQLGGGHLGYQPPPPPLSSRLSKEIIIPRTSAPTAPTATTQGSTTKSALASAYFPGQTKVS